ncbi:unnamed protein product [Arctia plantaginis]|uniref:Uncharacterized protein n=1 Tax=Arctia plantaginis TaxID=874455 RepID=A0A8S1AWD3_ARCPL|nr:unnamed protein product [Arctia plantaginis]CAB3259804.1 unnamed protein product [Arctia plantaginis]
MDTLPSLRPTLLVALALSYGYNTPLLADSGLGYASHGHYLYKRSRGFTLTAYRLLFYISPALTYTPVPRSLTTV